MSSSPTATSTPSRSSLQSDQADNPNLQYPLSDSDSSLIAHPSTTIMDSDTNSEDGLGYLSDSTYEIISQSSFQASDSENEDEGPATPQDTDVESVEDFGTATPSETSGCDGPEDIPSPPDHREESFEEQRLRAEADIKAEAEAEAYEDQAIIYTPEELEIEEQLSTPSLNTSTIRGSTITTSASNSIEEWITFDEPITSVADGLMDVTTNKQDAAAGTVEDTTSHIVDQVEEAAHNAVEACINLIDTVSRYIVTHLIEPAYQRLPSRDALAALLPEDPRATMPSLWAIGAFLATPFLINCIVTLAQSATSVSSPAAATTNVVFNRGDHVSRQLLASAIARHQQVKLDNAVVKDRSTSEQKALARSETGLSVFQPTTKPRAGWFGSVKAKAKAKAEDKSELSSEWRARFMNQTGHIVLRHNQPLLDQFQVNFSSPVLSRSVLFNPLDNVMHYPENEAPTMHSKIFRINETAVELQLPSSWPCGKYNISVTPYLRKPSSSCMTIFLTEKECESASSWKDFHVTEWFSTSFLETWRLNEVQKMPLQLWEELQAYFARQAERLRSSESIIDAKPSTTDGRCGEGHSNSVCGEWSGGGCCSKFGWCGNSSSHCGAGCQSGCKNSLLLLPTLPRLPKLPRLDTTKLRTPQEISQMLKEDLIQTREELRARADIFWEKLKEMNLRMTEYSAKSREERQLRREMKRAKALHRKLHRASETSLPSLPVKKARARALKLRDRADAAMKTLQFRVQQWEARIGREYLA